MDLLQAADPRRLPRWVGVVLFALAALALVACGGNPNENIESNEFARPSAAAFPTQPRDDAEETQAVDETDSSATEDDAGEQASDASDGVATDDPSPASEELDDEIELADDIVRRYLNEAYGYSLELVCGSFCDATSNGLDRVGFLSEDRTALINIEVVRVDPGEPPGLEELEALWQSRNVDNGSFTVLEREVTTLPSDGVSPAVLFEWTIDRRATGGFLEHYRSMIAVVGPIAYLLNAGSIDDNFQTHKPSLDRALDTFLARQTPSSLPGVFSRWEFSLPYDAMVFSGELGNRAPTPSFDSGVFIQQTDGGQVQILLIWDSISQALFDPDVAIDDALARTVGIEVDELQRGDASVDGVQARFAVASSVDQAGAPSQIAVYAWYCGDSGRSFVLQSFDEADPLAVLDDALSGFRCSAQ